MKSTKSIFAMTLLLMLFHGCATTMKAPMISYRRQGNSMEYRHSETGISVKVTISRQFNYQNYVEFENQGVLFKGPLFSRDNDIIMVTRITIDDFAKLTGVEVKFKDPYVGALPPDTSYVPKNCQLTRTYARSIGSHIIVCVYIRSLKEYGYPCDSWKQIKDISRSRPELIQRLNKDADRSVSMFSD